MNICLRTGERVYILMGEFDAKSFDRLFEGVKALPWEELLTRDAAFPVKGHSLNSTLHSIPDCQRIIKRQLQHAFRQNTIYRSFPKQDPCFRFASI